MNSASVGVLKSLLQQHRIPVKLEEANVQDEIMMSTLIAAWNVKVETTVDEKQPVKTRAPHT